MKPPKPPFYEDNPTYIAPSIDDGFWRTSPPAAQGLDGATLDAGAAALAQTPNAFSLLVIRNGVLVTEHYFHGSAANHSNNIHSASKGVLSALVGIAIEQGIIKDLDLTLGAALPRYPGPSERTAITLRDLLTMSAGFKWVEDDTEYKIEKADDWVQAILGLRLQAKPGARFDYCTGQSHLVSAVLTEAAGQSTAAFAQSHLFAPLGISVEHWGQDPQGYNSGGYNLYMTARALAKFALVNADGGRLAGAQLIPANWIRAATTSHLKVDADYDYGYYWWLTQIGGHAVQKLWGYGGQFAYIIPDLNLVVVMTADTSKDYDELDGDAFLGQFVVPAVLPLR